MSKMKDLQEQLKEQVEITFYEILGKQASEKIVSYAMQDVIETSDFENGSFADGDVVISCKRVLIESLESFEESLEEIEL